MTKIIQFALLSQIFTISVLSQSYTPCQKNPFPKTLSPESTYYSTIEFIDTDINSSNFIATAGRLSTIGYAFSMFAGDEEVTIQWQRQVLIDEVINFKLQSMQVYSLIEVGPLLSPVAKDRGILILSAANGDVISVRLYK